MGEDSRLRKGAVEKGVLQIAVLQMACATHEIFKSRYGLLGAPALSASLWFMVRSQLALRHAEHYLPLQREQCAALSIICDDERFLSSPTFPSLFIAGLTGGCPQDPTPCLCLPALDPTPAGGDGSAACWMENVLQQSTPAFPHQKHPAGLQPSLLATNFSLTLHGIVFGAVEYGPNHYCRRDV